MRRSTISNTFVSTKHAELPEEGISIWLKKDIFSSIGIVFKNNPPKQVNSCANRAYDALQRGGLKEKEDFPALWASISLL